MDKNHKIKTGRKSLCGKGESPVVRARVSNEHAALFMELGGAAWLRGELDRIIKERAPHG